MSKFLKINNELNFYCQNVFSENIEKKEVKLSAHHSFIIDCSGSMYEELPAIRRDLHNKIATMLKPEDSVTIMWFSGKNEYGVLIEDYQIKSATSLSKVKELINKYLTPQGLTAFEGPLTELKAVINRVSKRDKNLLHTLFFLTDGYDNCSSSSDIIKAVENLNESLSSATIVEYGWYCNKQLLNEIATAIGGVHTFSENFDDYEPYVEKVFNNSALVERKYIKLDHSANDGVVFSVVDGDIITHLPNEDNEILVSVKNEVDIFYFTKETPSAKLLGDHNFISNSILSGDLEDSIFKGLYASAFVYSRKSDYNSVSEVLGFIGDVELINQKTNTFGTQKISELESRILESVNRSEMRFLDGYDPNLEPSEDAYCVLDMIDTLMSSEENLWYPKHKSFSYKRTSGKAVNKKPEIKLEDKEAVQSLLENNDFEGLESKLEEIKSKSTESLKFNFNEQMPGSPISNLTWNEKRANLSVLVEYEGYVNIPDNDFGIDTKFDTKIYRNYTIIQDGIIWTYELPVSLSESTFNTLQFHGLLIGEKYESGKIYILNFKKLPVINRAMAKSLSAEDLFKKSYELVTLKASNYVFGQYNKKFFDKASKSFIDTYGKEAADWLKEIGLTANGFSPKKTIEKMNEEIEVNTLEVKIKGLTSNPTKVDFENAEKKIIAGIDGLSGKQALAAPAIREFLSFERTIDGLQEESKMNLIKEWIHAKSEDFRIRKNELMSEISRARFLTIVGKSWFKEFESREENQMTITFDDADIVCTVEDKQTTIKL